MPKDQKLNNPPIPEYLMKPLRERLGLEPDDSSKDKIINDRSPISNLQELCAWEFGDSSWANWFLERAKNLGITFP